MLRIINSGRVLALLLRVRVTGPIAVSLLSLFAAPVALATPALPSSAVASQAVKAALSAPAKAAAAVKPVKPVSAAAARAQGVTRASSSGLRSTGRSAVVHSTAYNSTLGQTDSTPFITATGTRVRSGVVALSRDLLGRFPYGTRLTIEDLSGRYSGYLRGRVFIVEDTMNVRIGNTVDIWMVSRGEAMSWGNRNIRITAVQ
ncbi:hypothetical protein [Deinococcus sp.]|uniref:3D domain-containing protein n=1 Tax=Deinococcus sp. TaxID=47478 RepID=UPI00286E38F3|nr:hypothetical protein [Deinococcus sp.]